jgi:hypothetical protein
MEVPMRDFCQQCRRVVQGWRKPVVHAEHIFCDDSCAEDYRLVEANIYALYARSPVDAFDLPGGGNFACLTIDP